VAVTLRPNEVSTPPGSLFLHRHDSYCATAALPRAHVQPYQLPVRFFSTIRFQEFKRYKLMKRL
jgi:hypothetical protein